MISDSQAVTEALRNALAKKCYEYDLLKEQHERLKEKMKEKFQPIAGEILKTVRCHDCKKLTITEQSV